MTTTRKPRQTRITPEQLETYKVIFREVLIKGSWEIRRDEATCIRLRFALYDARRMLEAADYALFSQLGSLSMPYVKATEKGANGKAAIIGLKVLRAPDLTDGLLATVSEAALSLTPVEQLVEEREALVKSRVNDGLAEMEAALNAQLATPAAQAPRPAYPSESTNAPLAGPNPFAALLGSSD